MNRFYLLVAFQNWVIRNLGIVKAQLNQIQESLDASLYNNQGQSSRSRLETFEMSFKLPMKTTDDLNTLTTEVKDLKLRELLVRCIFNRNLLVNSHDNFQSSKNCFYFIFEGI